jgi:hypothetical protein
MAQSRSHWTGGPAAASCLCPRMGEQGSEVEGRRSALDRADPRPLPSHPCCARTWVECLEDSQVAV